MHITNAQKNLIHNQKKEKKTASKKQRRNFSFVYIHAQTEVWWKKFKFFLCANMNKQKRKREKHE